MSNNFVSYGNAEALIEGINSKKVGKSDLTDIFATGTTNTTGSIITANTYFYLENDLVKALSDIAVNETFVEHTNYEVSDGALNEGSSGSGGHILQGQAGTDMIQRSRMQFLDAQVTDDSNNGKTKVEVVKQLTKSQLDALGSNTDGIYETTDEKDEELTGGGHTIKDGSGTAMTAQPNLQFVDAKVTNDAQGQATKIQNFVDIDWDDWQSVDDNDDTYYRVLDAPLADGTVEVDLMKLLWSNPSPTSAFAAQNITLASDDYDFLMVYVSSNITWITKLYDSFIVKKGNGAYLVIADFRRSVRYVSDTSLSVLDATASGTTNNNTCVPIAIYGFKKQTEIRFNALAENVSTLASKCMLDENTSVADVIGKGSVSVTADGTKTYATLLNELFALVDYNKVTGKSYLNSDGVIFQITYNNSTAYQFSRAEVSSNSNRIQMMIIQSTNSIYRTVLGTAFTNDSSTVPASGTKIEFVY